MTKQIADKLIPDEQEGNITPTHLQRALTEHVTWPKHCRLLDVHIVGAAMKNQQQQEDAMIVDEEDAGDE